jgi:hypothetical protein
MEQIFRGPPSGPKLRLLFGSKVYNGSTYDASNIFLNLRVFFAGAWWWWASFFLFGVSRASEQANALRRTDDDAKYTWRRTSMLYSCMQRDPRLIDTTANTETAPTSDGRANQTTMSALIDARHGKPSSVEMHGGSPGGAAQPGIWLD